MSRDKSGNCRALHVRDETLPPAEDLYVDEKHRRCSMGVSPKCCGYTDPDGVPTPHVGALACFYYRPTDNTVLTACRNCCEHMKETRVAEQQATAAGALANTIAKAIGRPSIMQDVPDLREFAAEMIKKIGGIQTAGELVGSRLSKILGEDRLKAKDHMEAARCIKDILVEIQKNAPEPLDLSSMSDDDILALLAPVAKDHILTNEAFRRDLLNDPDVRRALLATDGIEVVEALE